MTDDDTDRWATAGRFVFAVADTDTEHERRDGVIVRKDDERVYKLSK